MSKVILDGPVWLMQPIPYFGEELPGRWVWEPKIDGWRMQIIVYPDGRAELWGRRLERKPNWSAKLPLIAEAAARTIPSGTLLDSELTTKEGRRLIPSLFSAKGKVRPIVYVFDVVFYGERFVGDFPLEERKGLLKKLCLKAPFHLVRYKPVGDFGAHLEEAHSRGGEGLVLKDLDSPYQVSQDGPMATQYWRKVK